MTCHFKLTEDEKIITENVTKYDLAIRISTKPET